MYHDQEGQKDTYPATVEPGERESPTPGKLLRNEARHQKPGDHKENIHPDESPGEPDGEVEDHDREDRDAPQTLNVRSIDQAAQALNTGCSDICSSQTLSTGPALINARIDLPSSSRPCSRPAAQSARACPATLRKSGPERGRTRHEILPACDRAVALQQYLGPGPSIIPSRRAGGTSLCRQTDPCLAACSSVLGTRMLARLARPGTDGKGFASRQSRNIATVHAG